MDHVIPELDAPSIEQARQALQLRRRQLAGLSRELLVHEDEASETRGRDVADRAALSEALLGLEELRRGERQELDAIDRALARIEAGCYGRCVICEEPIAPRRIAALPWTPTCVRCVQLGFARD